MQRPARILSTAIGLGLALAACKPATQPGNEATAGGNVSPPVAAAAAKPEPAIAMRTAADAVKASLAKFSQVHSYHAAMQIDGGLGAAGGHPEIDFVAPDRYRITTAMGAQTIIGDTMYMQVQGRSMKMPMPKGTISQWRDPARLAESEADMTVRDAGSDSLDGVAVHKYMIHHEQPHPADVTLWIGADDLPVQMQVQGIAKGKMGTSTIRYSQYNDPAVQVDPPK